MTGFISGRWQSKNDLSIKKADLRSAFFIRENRIILLELLLVRLRQLLEPMLLRQLLVLEQELLVLQLLEPMLLVG